MSENLLAIMDLAKKMQDSSYIKNDFDEAMKLISNMFREKYINRMNDAVKSCIEVSQKNPPREVGLLYSLKPFMETEKHTQIDKAAEMLILFDAFKKLSIEQAAEVEIISSKSLDVSESILSSPISELAETDDEESIHHDGIYEIDEQCLNMQKYRHRNPANSYAIMAAMLLSFNTI